MRSACSKTRSRLKVRTRHVLVTWLRSMSFAHISPCRRHCAVGENATLGEELAAMTEGKSEALVDLLTQGDFKGAKVLIFIRGCA